MNTEKKNMAAFTNGLLLWHRTINNRSMPWKKERDPYKIWISEIILQQTRVKQGIKYYENFIKAFPTVHDLATSADEQVYKIWEGLGYYSRCRNLHESAKYISFQLNGLFPEDYDSILKLKGVGPYTAAAIASFAFDLPYAVLDGNVLRILSRILEMDIPVDTSKGKKFFKEQANLFMDVNHSAEYNQAIMDFGATICKPLPECKICFYQNCCAAYLNNSQTNFPVKTKKTKVRERWFNYFILQFENNILIHQRLVKDIWYQLFDFVLIETKQDLSVATNIKNFQSQYGNIKYSLINTYKITQRLSHQLIHFQLIHLVIKEKINLTGHFWIKISEKVNFAFPTTLSEFLIKIENQNL